jgi:catechol 2,3-dioxygenase-like lactoylglutathione lyase family enzyme
MVADMQRSIDFYTGKLGMKLLANYGGHFAQIQGPGVKIGLHPTRAPVPPTPVAGMSLGSRVADLDAAAAAAALAAMGVRLERSDADRGSRQARFSDPDGYPLYLIEIKVG